MKKKNNHKRKPDINQIFDKLARGASKTKKNYRQKPSMGEFIGKVQGSGRGFAFLIQEGVDGDLFLPARNLHGAMHGDVVKVKLLEEGKGDRGGVAEVIEVLEHGVKTFVGLVVKEGAYFDLIPDDKRIADRVAVLAGDLNGAQTGDKVVAQIIDYGHNGSGMLAKVGEVLGDINTVGVDVLSVIRSYGLFEEFDADVIEQAHAAPSVVDEKALVGREDFRQQLVITIDGEDAKDLDDAVTVRATQDGYCLDVHIADVSYYVPAGSPIDQEAYHRGTSVYFPDRVLPMLPQELSNGICSLNEGVDRLTTSCLMTFDKAGKRTEMRVVKGVIRSTHRMTYTKVQAILDGDAEAISQYPDLVEAAAQMQELAALLRAQRTRRGAIDFASEEPKIILDKQTGKIVSLEAQPRDTAHRIIEEFMLAANEAIAYKFCNMEAPFVYRIHETPSPEKIEALQDFVSGFGIKIHAPEGKVTPMDVQDFLKAVEGKPYENAVSKVALRAMQKAKYSERCGGHFGLAAEYYCHFTSPIRRYPDLSIHRVIGDYLANGKESLGKYKEFVAASSVQSSAREILAQEAEREVDDLKKAEYMHDHLGEEFDGVISGVTAFGIFVELPNTVEGLIRLETLPDESYEVDEKKYEIRGNRHVYRLGEPLRIRVVAASKETRKVEFVTAETTARTQSSEPEIRRMVMPEHRQPRGNGSNERDRQNRNRGQSGKRGQNGKRR